MTILAILTADWHLSHRPPIARSVEPNWYKAMLRPLDEVAQIIHETEQSDMLPLIVAGDLFDTWNEPAETANFVLRHSVKHDWKGRWFAVPGQHDLPNHRLAEIKRSPYQTLTQAGLGDLRAKIGIEWGFNAPIRLHGFPWGHVVRPLFSPHDLMIEIAVVHDYIHTAKTGYVGAPKNKRLSAFLPQLKGYDLAVFGDNHTPFKIKKDNLTILNCGSLMRRTIAQIDYKPAVWLLHDSGEVERHYLDISRDKMLEPDDVVVKSLAGIDAEQFLAEIRNLTDASIDFEEAVHRCLDRLGVSDKVRKVVLHALEKTK